MNAECKTFRADCWENALAEAKAFLKSLPAPGRVLSICHVSESPYAVVFVWYVA